MDTNLTVYNQNFTGHGEEFTKVSRAVAEANSYFFLTIHLNLASLVKNYHGIIEQLHLTDQKLAKLQNEVYVE